MSCLSRLNFFATILLLSCANVAQALDTSDVLVVDLYMNHESMGEAFVLQDDDGGYLVDESVLLHWNINAPWPAPRTFLGNEYYAIGKFPGASADLKDRLMELHISMPAELMATRYVDMRRRGQLAPATEFGVYMDYELNHIARERFGGQSSYGLFRPVVFGPQGSVNSNLLYRKFNSAAVTDESSGLVVLDLTYTRDDPSNVRSLRVGDIITRANRMGRALRFGGIQVATNFGTQPTMITYPLPSFYGQTEVPTALDIYVNGRLTRREEVQPGPYVLEDVPVVSGAGQLQVVARDALGRQQVFVQDFYLSTQLLREGLNDYSFNIGALREDFGIENFQYGDLAASATWRHGLRSDLITKC